MFKFLKEKLKKAVFHIGKKAEKEAVEEEAKVEDVKEEIKKKIEEEAKEKKGVFSFLRKKKDEETTKQADDIKEGPKIREKTKIEPKAEESVKHIIEPQIERKIEEEVEKEEKKLGIFGKIKEKITTTKISEDTFNELFEELELVLLENNVAVEVVERLKEDLKEALVDKPLVRNKLDVILKDSLKKSLEDIFIDDFDIFFNIKNKKPYVIVFLGVNGSGKTTTLAKFGSLFLKHKKSCVFAAADTFRAASMEQLEEHGKRLGIKVIKHDYGGDAGAVAFDAIEHAKAKHIDVVLIDTAGRLHNNKDLMREMEKICRVAKPDLKIFVGEAITGNDAVEQARLFNEVVGIDGIVLTKADVDEKGGAIISVSYVTKKPIIYIGVGQEMDDLEKFDKEKILRSLGF